MGGTPSAVTWAGAPQKTATPLGEPARLPLAQTLEYELCFFHDMPGKEYQVRLRHLAPFDERR